MQCVAWASTPPSEGDGESDRIVNVVATGGTDKVHHIFSKHAYMITEHPFEANKNLETVENPHSFRIPRTTFPSLSYLP